MNIDGFETLSLYPKENIASFKIHAARREYLNFLVNHEVRVVCPKCGSKQIQLMPDGTVDKPVWRCRLDKERFSVDGIPLAWPQVTLFEFMTRVRAKVAESPDHLPLFTQLKERILTGVDDSISYIEKLKEQHPYWATTINDIERDAKLLFNSEV